MLSTGAVPEISHADLLLLFQRAQAQFTDRVDAVAAGEWDAPALPGWSVADLVAHLTGEQLWVPPLLAGEPPDVVGQRIPTGTDELLGGDPLTAWETAADGALAQLPNDKPIVLHCKTGVRSAEALAAVKAAGFKDAVHVQGGVTAWATRIDKTLPTY